jgi:hypothetical protein
MLRFLRHIRRDKVSENNWRTYALYAFGEIILVVIGILIALQINNWNEDRKDREFERYVLSEIHTNLQQDLQQVSESLTHRLEAQTAIEQLNEISIFETDEEVYGKYVADLFTFERFYPIINGYEMLKSNGLIVTNEDLRSQLGQYYEYEVLRIQSSYRDLENSFLEDARVVLEKGYFDELTYAEMMTFTQFPNPDLEQDLLKYTIVYKENHKASLARIQRFKAVNEQLILQVESALSDL